MNFIMPLQMMISRKCLRTMVAQIGLFTGVVAHVVEVRRVAVVLTAAEDALVDFGTIA